MSVVTQKNNGILIINKPSGMTSHDIVDVIRRKFGLRRVGHAGTLDPLATGVLIVLVGEATSLFSKFSAYDKAYLATMTLGITTDSADIRGRVLKTSAWENVTQAQVEEAMAHFQGEIDQVPPMVSAVKVNGKRLYKLARQGLEVKREARRVTIFSLCLIAFAPPEVRFSLECSKGTYVRKLAEDIGSRLGCGACITQIHRTKVGPFRIEQAVDLDRASEADLIKI